MGFFRDVMNTASRVRRRREEKENLNENPPIEDPTAEVEKQKGGWIFKLLTYVAILGIFVDVAIAVIGLTLHVFTSEWLMWISIIAIICIGSLQSLTWIKFLMLKQKKAMSIVNLCFVGINVIMWIISVVLLINAYQAITREEVEVAEFATTINFVRAAIMITVQLVIANSIMNTIVRVKKRWIPFQIILYISQLYIDFYVCALLLSFTINSSGFDIGAGANFIVQPIAWTILLIAFIYVIIASAVLNGGRRRRRRSLLQNTGIADELDEENEKAEQKKTLAAQEVKHEEKSSNERLAELKNMLDEGLITQEEFDEKKRKILEDL